MIPVECYVIRHAQSQPDRARPEPEWPLSALGRQQAEQLRHTLAGRRIQQIYSSPYPRAIDTVRPLAAHLGIEVQLRPDLRERKLTGQSLESWQEELEKTWRDFDYALPDGESSRACQRRVRDCLMEILRRETASRIALSSHGNAIALLLNSLDSAFHFPHWKAMGNPHVYRLQWTGAELTWDRSYVWAPPRTGDQAAAQL
jgi:2,3-bisphosphoglycerate-dependent phosphoglycerate mutase